MTREEEIILASEVHSLYPKLQRSFIAGAKWADEHPDLLNILADRRFMIDKACEWIKYHNENGGCLFDNWEESFRKAMEEII